MSEIQNAMDFLKVLYPQFTIFLPPGYMSETQLEGGKSEDWSYWLWGVRRSHSAIQKLSVLFLKGTAAWFHWQKLPSCSIPPTAPPYKKRSVPVKRNVLYFRGRALPCRFNNSFCQILQRRKKNHPTISALEETCRMWQTRWNKQWPFPRSQKQPWCRCWIQSGKNKCRGGAEILLQDALPLCTNVSLLSSLVSILDIQMSLLWINAIQFGSAGQSLGSIRIFGQLVSTRMGLKGCCCLKEK